MPRLHCDVSLAATVVVEARPIMKLARVVKALNNALAYSGAVPLGVESDVMKLSSHTVGIAKFPL